MTAPRRRWLRYSLYEIIVFVVAVLIVAAIYVARERANAEATRTRVHGATRP